jgi:hypothetical protein
MSIMLSLRVSLMGGATGCVPLFRFLFWGVLGTLRVMLALVALRKEELAIFRSDGGRVLRKRCDLGSWPPGGAS